VERREALLAMLAALGVSQLKDLYAMEPKFRNLQTGKYLSHPFYPQRKDSNSCGWCVVCDDTTVNPLHSPVYCGEKASTHAIVKSGPRL